MFQACLLRINKLETINFLSKTILNIKIKKMGLFDLFRRKTDAEKNIISLRKLRKETIVKEKISLFHDMIPTVCRRIKGLERRFGQIDYYIYYIYSNH